MSTSYEAGIKLPDASEQKLRSGVHYNIFARSNDDVRCNNVLLKIVNRQHTGYLSTGLNKRTHKAAFREVPEQLRFCLKEIVPYCYLQGHVFMGLSACGQFLLSYKVSCDYDEVITSEYNFGSSYKYELFFWIYRPHFLLSKYFQVCLFDDHGVDDIKTVTITQWKTDQRLLIVHGASEKDDLDSYITVVRVPKLGCLGCKELRDATADDQEGNRQDILCIGCNMTIHTKYRNSDSGPKFNPRYNLACPGYIIMSENSFIHTINIELLPHVATRRPPGGGGTEETNNGAAVVLSSKYISKLHNRVPLVSATAKQAQELGEELKLLAAAGMAAMAITETATTGRLVSGTDLLLEEIKPTTVSSIPTKPKLSIADEIIADFAEYETESFFSSHLRNGGSSSSSIKGSPSKPTSASLHPSENYEELFVTCSGESAVSNTRIPREIQNIPPPPLGRSIVTRAVASRVAAAAAASAAATATTSTAHHTHTNVEIRLSKAPAPAAAVLVSPPLMLSSLSEGHNVVTRRELQSHQTATASPSSSSSSPSSTSSSSNPVGSQRTTPLRRRSYLSTRGATEQEPRQSTVTTAVVAAAKAYEFSEETERCEKISTFRRRRLADKKYEFTDDSSHGDSSVIIPFYRLRSEVRGRSGFTTTASPAASQSPLLAGSSLLGGYEMATSTSSSSSHLAHHAHHPQHHHHHHHLHRASPNHGFRSPCGSPVGNRYLRSPPGIRSPSYYRHHSPVATSTATVTAAVSSAIRQPSSFQPQSAAQLIMMSNFDPKDYISAGGGGSATANGSGGMGGEDIPKFFLDAINKFNEKKLLAAAMDGIGNNENINSDNLPPARTVSTGGADSKPDSRPICSKKIVKIFVEEDDANSVVTTEEDDCISPGYHASLPMEVHGSCYSNMQLISQASFNKLHCPAVIVTQNSFDMETFSFHVANHVCAKSGKKYGILFDSAYELTHVCPLTETLTCTMVLQFTASDTSKVKHCQNCSATIDCRTHRKLYQCRSLFTWNIRTGEWTVLDYGILTPGPYLAVKKLASNYNQLLGKLRKFTRKLFASSSASSSVSSSFLSPAHRNDAAGEEYDALRTYEYLGHLRVLDCNNEKTKQRLVDTLHAIEFFRKQPHDQSGGDSDDSDDDSQLSSSSLGNSSGNEEEEEEEEDDDDDANTVVGDTVSDEDDI